MYESEDAAPTSPGTVPASAEPATLISGGPEKTPGPAAAPVPFGARFRLISELARGGMGRVLVAHDGQLQREVAIKELLRATPAAQVRFEREALLTARLQHPGIVSVYELVRREGGEPLLVMRRVKGRPLDQVLADARTLSSRLLLLPAFTQICDAIAYAHQAGVIHRDLKPANVLLGDFGDTVVIDWGLAKEIGAPSEELAADAAPSPAAAHLTAQGAVMGTPVYMAPEQARGEPADPRTDVYALGAILYELLGGRRAYLQSDSREALRAVLSRAPPPLLELVPELPPELASLVGRAMAREPGERFASAGELAEELKRFQSGRLLRSHAYSTSQLVRRWAKRNAALLALSVSFLGVLMLAGGFSVRRIIAERDRANREAEVARQISGFMTGMFRGFDPTEASGKSITAQQVLDKAASRIEGGELDKDPLIQSQLLASLGDVYQSLGLYAESETALRKAADGRLRLLGAESPETLAAQSQLAVTLRMLGRFAEAERLQRAVLERRQRLLGPEHPDTLATMQALASTLNELGRLPEAEQLFRQLLETRRRALGPEDPRTLHTQLTLAWVWYREERLSDAEKGQREVLEAFRRLLGPGHLDTLQAAENLANTLDDQGRSAEAEKLYREALEGQRRMLGPEHPTTLQTMTNLGSCLNSQGRYADAERLLRELLTASQRALGQEHPDALSAGFLLGQNLSAQERWPEAEAQLRAVYQARSRALGPEHPQTLAAASRLSRVLDHLGRFDEAEPLVRGVLEVDRRKLGNDSSTTLWALDGVAAHLDARGRFAEAEPLYREARDAMARRLAKDDPDLLTLEDDLASNLDEQGRHAEAEALWRPVLAARAEVIGPDAQDTLAAADELAGCLAAQGRLAEAEALYRRSLEARRARLGAESPDALEEASLLGATMSDAGRAAEAERLLAETLSAQRRLQGPAHPSALDTQVRLARARAQQGRLDEARPLLEQVLEQQRAQWNAALSTTLLELGCLAARAEDEKAALRWLREAVQARPEPALAERMERREELAGLRKLPAFTALVARARAVPAPVDHAR